MEGSVKNSQSADIKVWENMLQRKSDGQVLYLQKRIEWEVQTHF